MITFGDIADTATVHVQKLTASENPFELFKKIYFLYDRVFILESLIGPKELAEMSVIGFDPQLIVTCDFNNLTVKDRHGTTLQTAKTEEPLSVLRKLMPKVTDNRFRYIGGAVGYINYDAMRFWEHLTIDNNKKTSNFPVLEFGIYDDGILFNHKENQAYYFFLRRSRLDEVEQKIAGGESKAVRFSYSIPNRNLKKSEFIEMVRKAKKYIYKGHIFQVVLAKRVSFRIRGNLVDLYDKLREVNPSPYMYMLKMRDRHIIGSSPEMLIRITNGNVETFPIAGTRPILDDEEKNNILRRELLEDEKEIAEHTMLVDLARNDIGKVCEFGTVKVKQFLTVKRFSHVQHIVSHVTGKMRKGFDAYDCLKAVFPAGTVSGAPKVRAMQIIDELEPSMRGPYAGAVGYFSFNGSCDFAIAIRSLFVNGDKAYVQSGAGIVIDSDPELEWAETEHKANAILSALKKAASEQ
ncbi:MAG: anthranilate synthase component I family protein [Nitrososphaera sp.]